MTRQVSMSTRRELVDSVGARYRLGSKSERSSILDEFVAITGYHRKRCIRLLSNPPVPPKERRPSSRYGPVVREALGALWEVSDRVCSKRLKVMIPALLPAMVRHGRITDDASLHAQLLAVSAATIDRLLASLRLAASKGRRRAVGQSSAVRRAVPIRTFGDWDDPAPGYLEVDFVAHCGPQLAGTFIQTLVLTDVATGWTECVPMLTRDGTLVINAIDRARSLFPFPMRGVDFDNDSVFMNERVVDGVERRALRSRERAPTVRTIKHGWSRRMGLVRRLVGYGRFEGLESLRVLTKLYAAARIHTNILQPSFKLRSKSRIGAKVVKRYHPPVPPADRVLAHDAIGQMSKKRLVQMQANADPVELLSEIRAAQDEPGRRVDQRGEAGALGVRGRIIGAFVPPRTAESGEQRAIHRRPYRRIKPVPLFSETAME